jgi:hypothetical protein
MSSINVIQISLSLIKLQCEVVCNVQGDVYKIQHVQRQHLIRQVLYVLYSLRLQTLDSLFNIVKELLSSAKVSSCREYCHSSILL